jgi:uncharacterized transporter YbjL
MLLMGAFIGYKEMAHPKLLRGLDKFQMAALLMLLFVMGVRIGVDKEVMGAIQVIGFKAIVFALITISLSVLFVWIFVRYTNKSGDRS